MVHAALLCAGLLGYAPPDTPATAPPPEALKAYEAEKAKAGRDPAAQVKLALWCEVHGLSAERVKHLALAVLADPSNAAARGLMGLLAYKGKWENPDAVSAKVKADEALTARLAEYNARREKLEGAGGQRRRVDRRRLAMEHVNLGLWCESNGLKPEATAHFTQAVVLDPYHEPTWRHLGYVKHNGRWMTREQIATDQRENLAQRRADRYWDPLFKRWREWLGESAHRDKAREELASVTDPRAVPALNRVFSRGPEPEQEVAVQVLGQVDAPSATRGIVTLALFSPSEGVRRKAAETLRRREPRDFAGALVDEIHAPMVYRGQPVGGPGSPGALLVETPRYKVLRTYDAPPAFHLAGFRGYAGYDANGLPVVASGFELDQLRTEKPRAAADHVAKIEAKTQQMIVEANLKAVTSQQRLIADVNEIEASNAEAVATNARVTDVLRASLGAPADLRPDDEDGWHRWWYDRIGYRYDPPPQVTLAVNASPQYPPPTITSCFVAGTPVRTIDGRKPIETLHVGDQILSQDVSTGALAFHPVMVVHFNPPGDTVKVSLDNGEPLTASLYHRFYRAGRGWAMARDLQTGDTLRTLGGLARVVALEPGPSVPVYNLDVATNRTFFVGTKDVLVHDNALPDPHARLFDAGMEASTGGSGK